MKRTIAIISIFILIIAGGAYVFRYVEKLESKFMSHGHNHVHQYPHKHDKKTGLSYKIENEDSTKQNKEL